MDDLAHLCCQNANCCDYGKRGQANLRVCFRYGPNQQRRMLACRTCQQRCSERQGTPLFDTRLPEDRVVSVLHPIAEGCGVRKTGRLLGVHSSKEEYEKERDQLGFVDRDVVGEVISKRLKAYLQARRTRDSGL